MLKSVAVTGGGGFIGSHLADALLEEGCSVTVIDDLSTGRQDNLESFKKHPKARIVAGNIGELDLKRIFAGMDAVFHQAALPSVPRSIKDPWKSNEVNVDGTLAVLIAAKEAGVKRVVYASSSSVYGDTPTLPKREDMRENPLSPYAVTKLAGEHYCRVFHHVYGLETVSLRYFNVFGPRQDPKSQYSAVIPLFISGILAGERPVILGDGSQSRDFSYVENVVRANILAATAKGVGGEVFNIATGSRITLIQLVDAINELTGKHAKPVFEKPREGDVKHSQADIGKAKKLLGYTPTVDFMEGLRRTVQWHKERA